LGDRDISFDCTIFGAISSFLLDFTDAVYKIKFGIREDLIRAYALAPLSEIKAQRGMRYNQNPRGTTLLISTQKTSGWRCHLAEVRGWTFWPLP